MKQNLNFDDVAPAVEEKDELTYRIDDYGVDLNVLIEGISKSY